MAIGSIVTHHFPGLGIGVRPESVLPSLFHRVVLPPCRYAQRASLIERNIANHWIGILRYIFRWGSHRAKVVPFSAPITVKWALCIWYFSANSYNPEKPRFLSQR